MINFIIITTLGDCLFYIVTMWTDEEPGTPFGVLGGMQRGDAKTVRAIIH
jgi:hypothetical protein